MPDKPSKVEKAMRAALREAGDDADIYVVEAIAEAVRDAEIARAKAAVRIPPGIPEMMERLRENFPDAKVVDHSERARMEKMLRDSPNALPLKEPNGASVVFIHSAEHLAAVKKQLGRE